MYSVNASNWKLSSAKQLYQLLFHFFLFKIYFITIKKLAQEILAAPSSGLLVSMSGFPGAVNDQQNVGTTWRGNTKAPHVRARAHNFGCAATESCDRNRSGPAGPPERVRYLAIYAKSGERDAR